jgi:predicted CoA-binding protein
MSSKVDRLIEKILGMKTIAVVGLSKDPTKPSHDVAKFLQIHGYRIVPINPTVDEVLGQKSYPSLLKLPDELRREIEVVDIFRRPEDVPPIVAEAVQIHKDTGHPKAVWMQLGIVNEEAARVAEESGIDVVMDLCMKIEYSRRAESPS